MLFHQENKNAPKKTYPRSSGLSQHPYTAPSRTKTRSKLLPAISTQRNTSTKHRTSTKQNPNQEENVSMMLNMDRICIQLAEHTCVGLYIGVHNIGTSVTVYSSDCKATVIDMIAEKVVECGVGIIKAVDAIKYSAYLSQAIKNSSIFLCYQLTYNGYVSYEKMKLV